MFHYLILQTDDQDQAKDLSIRGQLQKQQQQQQQHHQRQQQQLQHRKESEPEVIHISSRKCGVASPSRKRPSTSPSPVQIIKRSCNNSTKTVSNNNNNNGQSEVQENESNWRCQHCSITFPNQTLYFLHRGFHSDSNPWRCNGCGIKCADMYDFNTHLVSDPHR